MSDDPKAPPTTAMARVGTVELASGRAVEHEAKGDADVVRIRNKDGACVLTIEITDAGPRLRFEGAALELVAPRSLDISCGDLRIASAGAAQIVAQTVDIEAVRGGVQVRATDDVRLNGERVQLNSTDPPIPVTYDEYLAHKAARGELPPEGGGGGQRDS